MEYLKYKKKVVWEKNSKKSQVFIWWENKPVKIMVYYKLFFKKAFSYSCFLFLCKQICDNIWLQFKNKRFQILNFKAFEIESLLLWYFISNNFKISYICHWKMYLYSNLFKTFHLLTDVMSNMCFIWFRFFSVLFKWQVYKLFYFFGFYFIYFRFFSI